MIIHLQSIAPVLISPNYSLFCLVLERFAVRALFHRRICLMGSDLNCIECAVVYSICMVGTVVDCALDTVIFSVCHHGITTFFYNNLLSLKSHKK